MSYERQNSKLESIATSFSVFVALGLVVSAALYYPISIINMSSKYFAEKYYFNKYNNAIESK